MYAFEKCVRNGLEGEDVHGDIRSTLYNSSKVLGLGLVKEVGTSTIGDLA